MYPIRDLFFIITIAVLLVVGLGICLRSGLSARDRDRRRQLLGNLSRLLLSLTSLILLISMAHDWMGYRLGIFP